MNARFTTAATLALAFSTMLPARAADDQLLGMVMPDAKVLAGVNVAGVKYSPFGKYLLEQIQSKNQDLLELRHLTGFDPTTDVDEVLVASIGDPQSHTGLVLASGNFNAANITSAATAKGALAEKYRGVTILEDPQRTHGLAFIGNSIALAGDVASVKGAIDRQGASSALAYGVLSKVTSLMNNEDAWVLSTVPFSKLKPPSAPNVPNVTQSTAFQAVQQASAGVKFGPAEVQFTAQAEADKTEDATAMANVIQLLVNLAQTQQQQNPQAAALAKSVVVTANGNKMDVSLRIPEDQFQQMFEHHKTGPSVAPNARERRPIRGRQM